MLIVETVDQPVRGDVLRRAFGALDHYDLTLSAMFIRLLQDDSVFLDSLHYYSLRQIDDSLEPFFSNSTRAKIIKIIQASIQRQYFITNTENIGQ